jgi:hypothetical protein
MGRKRRFHGQSLGPAILPVKPRVFLPSDVQYQPVSNGGWKYIMPLIRVKVALLLSSTKGRHKRLRPPPHHFCRYARRRSLMLHC